MRLRATRLGLIANISAVVAALASPAAAQALASGQPAQAPAVLSFTPAFIQSVTGQTVRVTSVNGSQQKGKVTSPSATAMTVDGKRLSIEQIAKVEKVSHLARNYAIAGLAIGAVTGTGVYASSGCEAAVDGGCGQIFGFSMLGLAGGATIGAILNHNRKDQNVMYAKTRTTTVAFAPIVSPTRKGLAFSMSWR